MSYTIRDEQDVDRTWIEYAQKDLLAFTCFTKPDYAINWHHRTLANKLNSFVRGEIRYLMVFMPPRHGKLCSDSTKVLTSDGWSTHGKLKVGDIVFHPSGKQLKIIQVGKPTDVANIRVHFSNGLHVDCHENHEWVVFDRSNNSQRTVETNEFFRLTRFGNRMNLMSGNRCKYQIPTVLAVEFTEKNLPIHPYVLGAWLGDGTSTAAQLSYAISDREYIDKIISLGFTVSSESVHKKTGVVTTRFSGPRPNVRGKLTHGLQSLGVYGNKHIPDSYKYSSIEQRLELMAGLIDTDGYTEPSTGRVRIVTGSKKLADDISEVATTLGWYPYTTEQQPKLSTSGIQGRKVCYTVAFQPDRLIPVALPRKKINRFAKRRRFGIVKVEKLLNPEIGRCIQVDSPDGLYLVGEKLIPTHNSELVSRRLPAFIHGLYPDAEIMACSYLDSLAGDMTIDVQNIIDSPKYKEVFPGTRIFPSGTSYTKGTRNSSEHHIVGRRGKYRGQGVGGSFTGKGANVIIIDDPIKGREIADSIAFRERLWNFYNNDLFSRLETNLETGRRGQVLITQCMTGDTKVLMADGTETYLRNINIGDDIATYDNGLISVSTVKNWKRQGPDLVFAIRMSSGITVKANERHPFLVCENGELKWVRLKDLRVNDRLIRVGERGVENYALSMGVENQQSARGFVCPTTIKLDGLVDTVLRPLIQSHTELDTLDTDTELNQKTIPECLKTKKRNVPCVENHHKEESISQPIGKDCALTTTRSLERSGGCSATNAILSLSTETLKEYYSEPLSIYGLTTDTIVEISDVGKEDVFDIEVARTENFIANGLVSHNTRWHEDDLSGRLIALMKKDPAAVQWDILRYPAIRVDKDDETDQRQLNEALWPTKYNVEQLNEIKASISAEGGTRAWSSLYQQNPVPAEGNLFKERMFEFADLPGAYDYKFVTADTAYKEKKQSDFTVFTVWGVKGAQPFIIDVFREQIAVDAIEDAGEAFLKPHIQYGYRETLIEPRGHGIYLNKVWAGKGMMIPSDTDIDEFYSDRNKDKVERATNAVPHLARRKIYISNQIANKEELVAECLGFPNAVHDDFVDTVIDGIKRIYGKAHSILDVSF